MALLDIEKRLEQNIDGFFARMFKGTFQPVELGRKLTKEMDQSVELDSSGRPTAANVFDISMSTKDLDACRTLGDALPKELAEHLVDYAYDSGYRLSGAVEVSLRGSSSQKDGTLRVSSERRSVAIGTPQAHTPGTSRCLVDHNGQRIPLGSITLSIGRGDTNNVVLRDANVSRRHAEIRYSDLGYDVVDSGSTNGTFVNGKRVNSARLNHGDELRFGSTVLIFEQN